MLKKQYINLQLNTLNDREKTIIKLRKFKEKSINLRWTWKNVKNK